MKTKREASARCALGRSRWLWCILTASLAVACSDSQEGRPSDAGTVPTVDAEVTGGYVLPTESRIVILPDGSAAIAGANGSWIRVTLPGQGGGKSDAPLVYDPRTSMPIDSNGDGLPDDISCNAGYQRSGFICVDIDVCATRNGDCDPATTCTNTPGSFS